MAWRKLPNREPSTTQCSEIIIEWEFLKFRFSKDQWISKKQQRTNLFFHPDSWRLGNTWNLELKCKFQVFPSLQDRKTNLFISFFGRSYGLTILFGDLLTFSRATKICKVYTFLEGHKILRNVHLTFDCMYCSQM